MEGNVLNTYRIEDGANLVGLVRGVDAAGAYLSLLLTLADIKRSALAPVCAGRANAYTQLIEREIVACSADGSSS